MALGTTFAYPMGSTQTDDDFVLLKAGNPEPLESKATLAKLRFFEHCSRKDGSLEKAILLGLNKGRRRRGHPRRRSIDTVTSDLQLTLVNAIVFCRDRAGWRHHIRTVIRGPRRPDGLWLVRFLSKPQTYKCIDVVYVNVYVSLANYDKGDYRHL